MKNREYYNNAVEHAVWMRFGGNLSFSWSEPMPEIQSVIENVLRAERPNIWYPVLMSQKYED